MGAPSTDQPPGPGLVLPPELCILPLCPQASDLKQSPCQMSEILAAETHASGALGICSAALAGREGRGEEGGGQMSALCFPEGLSFDKE